MSNSLRPHGLQPTGLLSPWDSPGNNTGVGCRLAGSFSSPLHLTASLYHLPTGNDQLVVCICGPASFHSLMYLYAFLKSGFTSSGRHKSGRGVRLAVCPETVSPPVIVADRRPNQRHHHHGDDGRCNFRYCVACGNPGEQDGLRKNSASGDSVYCRRLPTHPRPRPSPPSCSWEKDGIHQRSSKDASCFM